MFWKDIKVDNKTEIQIKPGARFFNMSGSLEIPIGYKEIEIKKKTTGLMKDEDFLE